MRVYEYDIEDGDKGIIFAESLENAKKIFSEMYPTADPDCYFWSDCDQEKYEYGAIINEICEYVGREELWCTYSAGM